MTVKTSKQQETFPVCVAGCGGSLNELFGNLQVGRRSYYSYSLYCNWKIGNAGISQAVALVSLPQLSLSYYRLVWYIYRLPIKNYSQHPRINWITPETHTNNGKNHLTIKTPPAPSVWQHDDVSMTITYTVRFYLLLKVGRIMY